MIPFCNTLFISLSLSLSATNLSLSLEPLLDIRVSTVLMLCEWIFDLSEECRVFRFEPMIDSIVSVGQEGNQKIEIDDDDVDEVSFSWVMSVHEWIGLNSIDSFAVETTQIELWKNWWPRKADLIRLT